MEASAGVGLVARIVRALRLDPTLYREVTSPGAGNRQAVAMILITAAIWGFQTIFLKRAPVLQPSTGGAGDLEFGLLLTLFAVPAIAQIASWLIWAVGLRLIAARWVPRDREVPFYGQIARALAFAQAPVLLAAVIAVPATMIVSTSYTLPILPEGIREDLPVLAVSGLGGLVTAWVIVGTFVAVREALGLSNGRTLMALLVVNLVGAALLGIVVLVLSSAAGRETVGLMEFWLGFRYDQPTALDVAYRLDFNFGFLGPSDQVLYFLSRSILHQFAGVS